MLLVFANAWRRRQSARPLQHEEIQTVIRFTIFPCSCPSLQSLHSLFGGLGLLSRLHFF